MKASTLLFFTLLLTACGVARPVLESDSTKVEVKVVEKIVKDSERTFQPDSTTSPSSTRSAPNVSHAAAAWTRFSIVLKR